MSFRTVASLSSFWLKRMCCWDTGMPSYFLMRYFKYPIVSVSRTVTCNRANDKRGPPELERVKGTERGRGKILMSQSVSRAGSGPGVPWRLPTGRTYLEL